MVDMKDLQTRNTKRNKATFRPSNWSSPQQSVTPGDDFFKDLDEDDQNELQAFIMYLTEFFRED
jgi:hypothetical protein